MVVRHGVSISSTTPPSSHHHSLPLLMLNALGVIYGDIGTSPLYVLSSIFSDGYPSQQDVLGATSIIVWALMLICTVKYIVCVLTADANGEGGVFALLSLIRRAKINTRDGKQNRALSGSTRATLMLVAMFGASLLLGDGIITPAISILAAVEGIAVGHDGAIPYVVPICIVILLILFGIQRYGTGSIGVCFGPIMLLWFLSLAIIGIINCSYNGLIFAALSPHHAVWFIVENGSRGFIKLGAVVLCCTGVEALYADLGHFGAGPIRLSWLCIVFPSLLLTYLGQGARLISDPTLYSNTFFLTVPSMLFWPQLILATLATVIASQALISGAFSLVNAAIRLQFLPKLRVYHTSSSVSGQIYIPAVNYTLMVLCCIVVFVFQSSERLSSAYGVAVCADMCLTSILFLTMMNVTWHTHYWKMIVYGAVFLPIDITFLSANLSKTAQGGWFPLLVASFVTLAQYCWYHGRTLIAQYDMRLAQQQTSHSMTHTYPTNSYMSMMEHMHLQTIQQGCKNNTITRVHGVGVFITNVSRGVPPVAVQLISSLFALPRTVIFLSVRFLDIPVVPINHRCHVTPLGYGMVRATASYGYAESHVHLPDITETVLSLIHPASVTSQPHQLDMDSEQDEKHEYEQEHEQNTSGHDHDIQHEYDNEQEHAQQQQQDEQQQDQEHDTTEFGDPEPLHGEPSELQPGVSEPHDHVSIDMTSHHTNLISPQHDPLSHLARLDDIELIEDELDQRPFGNMDKTTTRRPSSSHSNLLAHARSGSPYSSSPAVYYVGREMLVPISSSSIWHRLVIAAYNVMSRNCGNATAYYEIPTEQVLEVGRQITI